MQMGIYYSSIVNFLRFLAQSLSFPFSFFNKKLNYNFEKKVLIKITKIISTSKFKQISTIKTKTHHQFSENLLELIKKKNLRNFLSFFFFNLLFF